MALAVENEAAQQVVEQLNADSGGSRQNRCSFEDKVDKIQRGDELLLVMKMVKAFVAIGKLQPGDKMAVAMVQGCYLKDRTI